MVDLALPLIIDADQISFELLDLIMSNLIEPIKSTKEDACKVSKELILKTKDTLEPYIKAFLNHILLEELEEDSYVTAPKVFELLKELHLLVPNMLVDVMPNLECKLKSTDEVDRTRKFYRQSHLQKVLIRHIFNNFRNSTASGTAFLQRKLHTRSGLSSTMDTIPRPFRRYCSKCQKSERSVCCRNLAE